MTFLSNQFSLPVRSLTTVKFSLVCASLSADSED